MMNQKEIQVNLIDKNPFQSRSNFNDDSIRELARTIERIGLLNPPLVRPCSESAGRFQLVHGERRLKAVKLLGWESVLCVVRELDDEEMIKINLIENLQRENLNPMEEAQGFQELRDKCGLRVTDIAEMIGKSRPFVSNSLRLLEMPFFLRACVLHKTISAWHARVIMGLPEWCKKYRLADLVMDWFLSVEETRRIVQEVKAGNIFVSWFREVPVNALHPYMSRGYTQKEYSDMVRSMRDEGLREPIGVFTHGTIIDGVLRVNVAKTLRWEKIEAHVFFDVDCFQDHPEDIIIFPGKKRWPEWPPVAPPMSEEQRRCMHRLVEMLRAHYYGQSPKSDVEP